MFGKSIVGFAMALVIGLTGFTAISQAVDKEYQPNTIEVANTIDYQFVDHQVRQTCAPNSICQAPMSQAPMKQAVYQAPMKSYSSCNGASASCGGNARGGGLFGRASVRQERRAARRGGC